MKKVSILLITIGVLAIPSLWGSVDASDDPMSAAGVFRLVEKPAAPDFTLEDLQGNRVKLEDFRGNIALLFFWTTW